ncbi:hypothetical protein A2U01_0118591, partial [Trifolium medium]|nr:hypothetical protein [Trifolium medium]
MPHVTPLASHIGDFTKEVTKDNFTIEAPNSLTQVPFT